MTDRNRLRLLCAAQAYLPSEVVVALLDQLDDAEAALRYREEQVTRRGAERDALAAKLDAVRALAEYYVGLTNVDAGSAILRALDAETGGES